MGTNNSNHFTYLEPIHVAVDTWNHSVMSNLRPFKGRTKLWLCGGNKNNVVIEYLDPNEDTQDIVTVKSDGLKHVSLFLTQE